MVGKFAFSFDRESFHGSFETRQAALEAATLALKHRDDMPPSVFVGQWSEPETFADHHAEAVLDSMRDRWHQNGADDAFLKHVTEQQAADLDHAIEQSIRGWLAKHKLLPNPTRVRAVSEHGIPNVHHVAQSNERETSVIGEA